MRLRSFIGCLLCCAASSAGQLFGQANPWQSEGSQGIYQSSFSPSSLYPQDETQAPPESTDLANSDTTAMSQTPAPEGAAGAGQTSGEQNNGTNPAQNATTAIISNEYYRLSGGNQINNTYFRLKFPVYEKRGAVIFEVPFNYYDVEFPIDGEVGGLGDIKVQFNYNAWVSCDKRLTVLTMLESFIPSADNVLLTQIPDSNQFTALDIGTGQFVLGPGLGLVYAPRKNLIIAPLYFYEGSVAGIDSRPEINRGKLRVFMMYARPNGSYLLPEFQMVSNFNTGNEDVYVAPEVGLSRKGTTIYVKPGIGIAPGINDREWGLEFGGRIMF